MNTQSLRRSVSRTCRYARAHESTSRTIMHISLPISHPRRVPATAMSTRPPQVRTATHAPSLVRWSSNKALADEKIEEITELYATARDEFEIAMEETEKQTVYAEDDRAAAREEFDKVQEAFRIVVEGADKELAEEVQRRIGHRLRELENGIKAMEELAQNHD